MFKQVKHVENIFLECYFDNFYCGALEKKLTKKSDHIIRKNIKLKATTPEIKNTKCT